VKGSTIEIEDLKKHLKNVVVKGDPVFVITFKAGDAILCRLNIKCSLVLKGLLFSSNPPHSMIYTGKIPAMKGKSANKE